MENDRENEKHIAHHHDEEIKFIPALVLPHVLLEPDHPNSASEINRNSDVQ